MASIINHFGDRYRHTIVALDGRYGAANRVDPRLPVTYADAVFPRAGLFETAWRSRAFVGATRPDLLLTYNWGAIEWAAGQLVAPQCRHVHLESGFGPEEASGQIVRRAAFRRIALARADRLIVPSHGLVDIACSSWRMPNRRIVHIPNGVDCDTFARAPDARAIEGFVRRPGERVVGTVAPLRPEKNIARLLRAFAALPQHAEARLLIIGDGEERPQLVALARELGIAGRTVFAGHVDGVERVIGLIDVFALSSDTEQMPNTILQAMAAGLAIAAADVGDVKRLLPPACRDSVVPPTRDGALAGAIARLILDDAARAAAGRANQAHARATYHMQRMFDAYGAVFDTLVPAGQAVVQAVGVVA